MKQKGFLVQILRKHCQLSVYDGTLDTGLGIVICEDDGSDAEDKLITV